MRAKPARGYGDDVDRARSANVILTLRFLMSIQIDNSLCGSWCHGVVTHAAASGTATCICTGSDTRRGTFKRLVHRRHALAEQAAGHQRACIERRVLERVQHARGHVGVGAHGAVDAPGRARQRLARRRRESLGCARRRRSAARSAAAARRRPSRAGARRRPPRCCRRPAARATSPTRESPVDRLVALVRIEVGMAAPAQAGPRRASTSMRAHGAIGPQRWRACASSGATKRHSALRMHAHLAAHRDAAAACRSRRCRCAATARPSARGSGRSTSSRALRCSCAAAALGHGPAARRGRTARR